MSGGRKSPTQPPVYSDRFVPSRSASAGLRGFNLLDSDPPTASTSHPVTEREVRGCGLRARGALLRFGGRRFAQCHHGR
jgi:hypothetical protein